MITLAKRFEQVLPSATLELTAKAKDLKAKGNPVVSLAAGEPDFPMPQPAQVALREALQAGFTRYTPTSGILELKTAIKKKIKQNQGLQVQESHIAVSCGAKHALYNLIQVMCSEGDEILMPKPYWVSYPEMVKLAGAEPTYVETQNNRFLMTKDAIEKALTPKTKIIILNSPSNPTGAVLPERELRDIAKLLTDRKLFCISDEIYEYYVYDGLRHVSIASLLPDFLNQMAIVNGVSKSYAMTGLRIGYTVAQTELIKKIGILQDHSTSNPVSLSQKAAIGALSLGDEYKIRLRKSFEKKRDLILGLLQPVKKLKVFKPQGAFYVFVSVERTGLSPKEFSDRLLQEKFVATIPGESFGSDQYVRLSFAASEQDIQEGCRRITEWVTHL